MPTLPYRRLDLDQSTDTWRRWRQGGLGAADAPVVMGNSHFKNADTLLAEKVGPLRPWPDNFRIRRGTVLEPEARVAYTRHTGYAVEAVCLQSTRYPWMRASLDGFSAAGDVAVEIKCGKRTYRDTHRTEQPPPHYMAQLQHILVVTDLASIDFWCYGPKRKPLLIPVPRDEAYIAALLAAELAFWERVEATRQDPAALAEALATVDAAAGDA